MEELKRDVQYQRNVNDKQNSDNSDYNLTQLSNRDNNQDLEDGYKSQSDQICESNPNTPGARQRQNYQVIVNDEDSFSASTSNNNSNTHTNKSYNFSIADDNHFGAGRHRQDQKMFSNTNLPINTHINNNNVHSNLLLSSSNNNNNQTSLVLKSTTDKGPLNSSLPSHQCTTNLINNVTTGNGGDGTGGNNTNGDSNNNFTVNLKNKLGSDVTQTTVPKKEKRRGSIKKKNNSLLNRTDSQQQKQTNKKQKSQEQLILESTQKSGSLVTTLQILPKIPNFENKSSVQQNLDDLEKEKGYESSSSRSESQEELSDNNSLKKLSTVQSQKLNPDPLPAINVNNRTISNQQIQENANKDFQDKDQNKNDNYDSMSSNSSSGLRNRKREKGEIQVRLSQNNDGSGVVIDEDQNNFGLLTVSKDLIPPPEPLLPKTIAPSEPLRSGAPTPFLKLKPFISINAEVPCKQTDEPVDKQKYKIDNAILNEQSLKSLFMQEFRSGDGNPVVYNRYSNQFGQQNQAYQNSAYQLLKSEINPMTLLVNVKELISVEPGKGAGPGSIVLPYYTPNDENDRTLVFESRFESGNLAMAFKLGEYEYNLVLSNDINTKGHTQWFFYRVTNIKKDQSVKFNILNHTKPDSLFNLGMKVLVYSEQINKETGIGWHRDGRDIAYFQNNFKKDSVGRSRYFYTLTFTYDFKHDDDSVFFAYSYPYTYTDLTEDLISIERDQIKNEYMSRNILCRTIAGNKCEYLTITAKNHPDQKQERKGVFLSSRIHPGESNASWMMKGIIDFLVSSAPEAQVLREKFVFKIVPMLNPDGVINGNYRCSLAGADLNRRWKAPAKLLFPEVFESKKLCKQFQKERQIVLYCDLHGHSRNKNIFIYGNNYSENPESTRLFPFIMSKVLDSFSYDASRFSIHKSKEATARVSMWRELKIPAVYTMEASFCGPQIGKNAGLHYTTEHFMEAGMKLLIALLIYCDIDVPKSLREINNQKKKKKQKNQSQQVSKEEIQEEIAKELKEYTRKGLIAELMGNKNLLNAGSKDDDGDEGGGSESDPSEDNMEEEDMAKIIPIKVNASKKKVEPKKQLPVRKQFKQEEMKDQKTQQIQAKKSPTKKLNNGGSFFDRVRLPKSYGMRRVEMVDAWTQTSNRGSDNEESKKDKSKDEGTQAQAKDLTEINNIDVSPTRPRHQLLQSAGFQDRKDISESPEKISSTNNEQLQQIPKQNMFNIDSIRNIDSNASQSVIISNPNKNRILVPSSQKRQSLSPNKNEFTAIRDRMQAMQIINQYIKESQMSVKSPNPQGLQYNNDPYNFFIQQQQQYYSPDKNSISSHIYNTEKKPSVINQLQLNRQNILEDSSIQHKRQNSNNPQHYYFDSNQTVVQQQQHQNLHFLQQLPLNRGQSDGSGMSLHQNQRTLEFKDMVGINSTLNQQQAYSNNQQSNRLGGSISNGQSQGNNNQQNNQANINMRSLSGNSYLRSMKQRPEEYNPNRLPLQGSLGIAGGHSALSNNTINNNLSLQNSLQSQQQSSPQKGSFNAQHLMQTGTGNSRATTLPQLNNDSMQKSSAIKQNKSQSFYEGIKAQSSFKATTNSNPNGGAAIGLNFKNDYKNQDNSDYQFFNSSFIKGNVSPIPFENMPHYSFKIKPTMIVGNKSSTKQLNNSQITNETKRLYQSQPNEEFTPQSTQNREQLSSISQKWNTKNRAHHNLNSGGVVSAGGSHSGMTHTSSSNIMNNSFIQGQMATTNNNTITSSTFAAHHSLHQNPPIITGGKQQSPLQSSQQPQSITNSGAIQQLKEQTGLNLTNSSQISAVEDQKQRQNQQNSIISKKQRKPSDSLGVQNANSNNNNAATSKSFIQSSNTANLFIGSSSKKPSNYPQNAQQAVPYRKNKL